MKSHTVERITTHGRSREARIASATDVFPDPELPAMPMMLISAQGGLYCGAVTGVPDDNLGPYDSILNFNHVQSSRKEGYEMSLEQWTQNLIFRLSNISNSRLTGRRGDKQAAVKG